MVVAEVLAGIALVKSSVDFIKSNIDTAKDIGEIAGAIDGLFQGAEQCQKQRNKKSGVSVKDQFGINSVAQEVIDAKLAEEKLQEMRTLVDMRFGPGTWQSILDLRAKRIQEEKEARRLRAIQKRKEEQEFWEQMKTIAIIVGCIIIGGGAFILALTYA
ncbi:MAG TPA: hypothetical protein DCM40_09665 [Maribacter sp.]|jgi:hypothetical protein|nr:hypothetical protein [Pusillimonas sp.]HAI38360.1 hypothetical protein [Maribacter sp.]|tara:strand:+ start:182 stop:658 length:477 start_codon:yes stop_codon:yes gene_type:complete